MTNAASLVVDSNASLSVRVFSRPLNNAMTRAPEAPMAPPSVGVAMPRKIVPNTRKISARGGTRTMITFSASLDNRPSLKCLFRSDRPSAKAVADVAAHTNRTS